MARLGRTRESLAIAVLCDCEPSGWRVRQVSSRCAPQSDEDANVVGTAGLSKKTHSVASVHAHVTRPLRDHQPA
jgi:hypothetical protein